ncbi:MAG: DUF2335 domain-containing protein, partial [Candidatus Accumulibacter sp.]|nr:DUF2335 domain-containing protein [Accumulibacter sp.]
MAQKPVRKNAPDAQATLAIHRQQETFSGPIPHPEILKKYAEIVPDAPERILAVFEKDSEHLRVIEREALRAEVHETRLRNWMAFGLAGFSLVAGTAAAFSGHEAFASVIVGASCVGLVTGFLQ